MGKDYSVKQINHNKAFLELVRAGLWEKEAKLLPYDEVDFDTVLRLSEEQSVVGLVTAGFEHVVDKKIPQTVVLQFIGESLQIESRNQTMNAFIASIVEKMRQAHLYGLLVKGSGLAQCYERPLWRACGDIDFFFSKNDYSKAIEFFSSIASETFQDSKFTKSYGVIVDDWTVEIHGTLRCGLSSKTVKETDRVQRDVFYGGDVQSWQNGKTQVFLPGVNSDIFLLFTHFVRHFYQNEFVLRQLCDWCRFLWTYREKIDVGLLEKRLRRSGLMSEWKAFATLAVDFLEMPVEAVPLYSDEKKWHKKGEKILNFIINGFEPNKVKATFAIGKIFPWNTIVFSPSIFFHLNWVKVKERLFGDGNR